jgi:SAM-dependent methyltransferase
MNQRRDPAGMSDPKQVVRDGYDRLGDAYRPADQAAAADARGRFLGQAFACIPSNTEVLELGCGPGWDAVSLADRRRYTGVDISTTMLALARERVPSGTFVEGDLTTLDLPENAFDAVVSLYVFGHIPAAEHLPTYRRVASWLRPDGVFCASFPLTPGDDVEDDWRGVPMFFGGIGREATEQGLRAAGFDLELSEVRENPDPSGGIESFLWVIARRR